MTDTGHTTRSDEYGTSGYRAVRGDSSAFGLTPGEAAFRAGEMERRARAGEGRPPVPAEGGFLDAFVLPVLANASLSALNVLLRPLPTVLTGTAFLALHQVALALGPGEWWWRWGAHVLVGTAAFTAMATHGPAMEREEGRALNALAAGSRAAWMAVYWAAMVASVAASAWMAGLAFEWLAGHGWIRAGELPFGADGVRIAAGGVAFAWRRAFHPTLLHPALPGTRL